MPQRHIPATMATQHPDNACAPYWEKKGDGFISTAEEVDECASAFKDLDCQEFMWDWEGKYVDEAVVDRLFHDYHQYFKTRQLGRDKFLTFRIPNTAHERGYSLARAFMGIITAESFARDLGLHIPPIFEVILPMTDKAESIIKIQDTFNKLAIFKAKLFGDTSDFSYLHVLPLFEGVNDLLHCRNILERYLVLHTKRFKHKPSYLRLHIARSDPALNSGLVAAVVAGKIAMSEQYQFGRAHGIKIYPAIGVGTLPFRGSLSPERIANFIKEYPGLRTVYVQSAFRYDFPLAQVKAAIKKLNDQLPHTRERLYNKPETADAAAICHAFSAPYKTTVESLAHIINRLAKEVPARRERKQHIGLFGYSRTLGKKSLPRAIPFTAVLYSLGLPPELIGTGRGLAASAKAGLSLEPYYHNFKADLLWAGRFLNKTNLKQLAKNNNGWSQIARDVDLIEKHLKITLGPKNKSDFRHQQLTTQTLARWRSQKDIGQIIMASGKIRKSLG